MKDQPAFPAHHFDLTTGEHGLTKREYAAIHLRVPNSGNEELDAMIREAKRDELAARAMEALCVSIENNEKLCRICGEIADAMLKSEIINRG